MEVAPYRPSESVQIAVRCISMALHALGEWHEIYPDTVQECLPELEAHGAALADLVCKLRERLVLERLASERGRV